MLGRLNVKNTDEVRCVLVCKHCKMARLFVFLPGTESEQAAEIIMQQSKEHDSNCCAILGEYNITITKISNGIVSTVRKEEI